FNSRRVFCRVKLAESYAARFIDDEKSAVAGACGGRGSLENSVPGAHFSVWPEVAAEDKVERTDVALPNRGVHDRIHANAHNFRIVGEQFLPFCLVTAH